MFVDHIKIHAKAGDGGNGMVHFHREKFLPKGGPDGGDGGKGGDVILRVDQHIDTLKAFFYQPHLRAENGGHGQSRQKTGRSGKDLILSVPSGTLVYRCLAKTLGEASIMEKRGEAKRELVIDLIRGDADTYILAKGGEGGKGNTRFKSATNRTPREFTYGVEGEEGVFYLELRKIADIGLVGFPNAGKSTLVSKLSAAKPKVASYPFTTLKPLIGVIYFNEMKRATIADIPGLIEGAHRNVGLGFAFLKHVMRCKLLLFVLDMAGSEGRNPWEDLSKLRREISLYDESLAQRPWFIVANKMDLPQARQNLEQFEEQKISIIAISAKEGKGLERLKEKLEKELNHPSK